MIKVLLVDDEVIVRTAIKRMVQLNSYNRYSICGEAENGEIALKLINELHPHIIISDIRMPKLNGYELLREVRKLELNIKFIILSNYDDFEYVRECLRYGATDYILKHNLNKDIL